MKKFAALAAGLMIAVALAVPYQAKAAAFGAPAAAKSVASDTSLTQDVATKKKSTKKSASKKKTPAKKTAAKKPATHRA
jgi:outer membrane lipoprotein-sorting protein